ncbi:glucose-1-phosphate adenylyltransferase subunit GlgD [Evansella sp. AB-P1]|uniref:glucose-1-phosphate adenylyltransferase subunit GlgD n=1 Tax=Evansella sp. AB-P1 TaxID=3037653 RepID=UPI00241C6B29|nr:glucose-1-phosphate adenylyltransferase subunit GlgD [Evansella sp. AB-P1]MDG5787879.1 glucose-1-phosphate adenylyltransferase subunit GlgD [Evansella sp. AB-P1]
MKSLMGLINLEHEHDFLKELTYFRCGAAVPFAGRYRLIDFTLSNMIQSRVKDVAIFCRSKYRSLMDHLGTGGNWELARRNGGLFILPPDFNDPTDISKGDLQYFHNNRDYFLRGSASHVVVSGSQFISNNDYQEAFQHHLKTNAEITLIYTKVDQFSDEHSPCLRAELDEDGWVTNLTNDKTNPCIYTGVYIINKDLLIGLVDDCIAHHKDHFFQHGIKDNISKLKVQTFEHKGYCAFINSVDSFFKHNMDLLSMDNYKSLFYKDSFIKTKNSNEPPTKYKDQAEVKGSLIANGCVINGVVEKSVLFRGVNVKEGASIKNSVIMQRCTIESGVHLENVILDKDVYVTAGQTLIGGKDQPFVVAKRKIM